MILRNYLMHAEGDFDNTVAGFYRAAAGELNWAQALMPLKATTSAFLVQLLAVDMAQGAVAFSHEVGDISHLAQFDYFKKYHQIDPHTRHVAQLAPGQWFNSWEHYDDNFVATNPFYQEFLIPYGGRYTSGTKLLEDGPVTIFLGVHRGLGSQPLTVDEVAVCKRLAGHLGQALRLFRSRQVAAGTGGLGIELISRLGAPLALIDDQRHVHYCNGAAKALFAEGDDLLIRGGNLYCRRPSDDTALLNSLRYLGLGGEAAEPSENHDKAFLRVSRPLATDTIGLYLMALRPEATLRVFGDRSLAMAIFHVPGKRVELDPFIVAASYDLTPGEARVALAIVRGEALEEIARHHHVSITTVRTQLAALFQKTGTRRQAELVSLLASMPMAALNLRDDRI
jgi:DNA-binding CsgD family transcriptional regulator